MYRYNSYYTMIIYGIGEFVYDRYAMIFSQKLVAQQSPVVSGRKGEIRFIKRGGFAWPRRYSLWLFNIAMV